MSSKPCLHFTLTTASLTDRQPEIKKLQIQLTGFLEKDTPAFCKELWKLCLSAQNSPQGVPKELLEAKKLELIQEKVRRSIFTLLCYTLLHNLYLMRAAD
jgi:hypothetical protein